MRYELPLAYVLGLEGMALLRAFSPTAPGDDALDRAFVEERLREVRRLLDDPALRDGVEVAEADTVRGYTAWAATYDTPNNAAFDIDDAAVAPLLETVTAGDALDAACGTGRHSRRLRAMGHRVIGVDSATPMLDLARQQVPDVEFRSGDLTALPVPDAAVDLVLCTLALNHQPDLAGPFAEFARVLRPGGHLIVSDVHPEAVLRGSVPAVRLDGRPARLVVHRHPHSAYLRAALDRGLELRDCREPVLPPAPPVPATTEPGPWSTWPWSLAPLVPEAARAANAGSPAILAWHFQRPAG